MKFIKGIVLVLLLGFGCSKAEVEEAPLIPDEKMINILVDLHIAESAILSANKSQKDSIGSLYFAQVFEMHGIQDSLFYKNLNLISKNPNRTEAIYEKVVEQIDILDLDKDKKKDEVGTKKK